MSFRQVLILLSIMMASTSAVAHSAYEAWGQLLESANTRNNQQINAYGTGLPITFGGEKEASSSKLTRIYGPKNQFILEKVSLLRTPQQREFLVSFLRGIQDRSTFINEVRNVRGEIVQIDLRFLDNINLESLSRPSLLTLLEDFLEKTNDKSFSFLTEAVRSKLFLGTFPGLTPQTRIHPGKDSRWVKDSTYANEWASLYGEPEKYILSVVGQLTQEGWEILTVPQKSYGDFLKLIDWLQSRMGSGEILFGKPQHNWIVIPSTPALQAKRHEIAQYLNYLQVYIILESLAAKTGIEKAAQKRPHPVEVLEKFKASRGTIRIDSERFGNALGIELRDGTTVDHVQEFMVEALVSHLSTLDFDNLKSLPEWLPNYEPTAKDISNRFDIDYATAVEFIQKISETRENATKEHLREFTSSHIYLAPVWNWDTADFLSLEKRKNLKKLARIYMIQILRGENISPVDVRNNLSEWSKNSGITPDVKHILTPQSKKLLPHQEAVRKIVKDILAKEKYFDFQRDFSKVHAKDAYADIRQALVGRGINPQDYQTLMGELITQHRLELRQLKLQKTINSRMCINVF